MSKATQLVLTAASDAELLVFVWPEARQAAAARPSLAARTATGPNLAGTLAIEPW
ncbi:MAG: hypothetical protein U0610_31095 [bacterium]